MSEFSNALGVSMSGLRAQAQRLRHVSENIANVDTPGFKRKTVSFEQVAAPTSNLSLVEVSSVHLDQSKLKNIYAPSHPLAGSDGYYSGSNVDVLIEIADAREAQRSYDANLKMFEQSKKMATNLLSLLQR